VVEMHREDAFGENFRGGADNGLDHALVGIAASALGKLDDERRLCLGGALEEAHGLLGVVDVVRADGEFAVGDLEELRGGDDHRAESRGLGWISRG
jgi:hypothetical protein